ncbi:hypothetical protein C3F09_11790 [candidate division GN15 bacterium]|uniref:Uncharacterized protein n=1 Tax=candidate division GN15 bacterium TaxID=2072418 RepID=A0A855X364_9BACT|nr:MAG: hypothetical protein C3F09_11790 [candidate division GN15 bacterium]
MLAAAGGTVSQSRDQSVLRFYWDRARAVSEAGDPIAHGARFSYEATTYYKSIGKAGVVTLEDSLKEIRFYSFGNLDSTRVLVQSERKSLQPDLSVPAVFDSSYILNFFPNDTGGPEIAIGFEADSAHADRPEGLAILDRNLYYPKWLYLSYRHKSGFRHFSRAFRFTQTDGFIFPDSTWEVAVIDQIFTTRSYRIETGVTNLKVYR